MREYSVSEFAAKARVTKATVYDWCKKGLLNARRCDYPGLGYSHWIIIAHPQSLRWDVAWVMGRAFKLSRKPFRL